MRAWLEELGSRDRFGAINRFNHGYPVQHRPATFVSTLEIGAGNGDHLAYEHLTELQRQHYVAVDLRANVTERLRQKAPDIQVITADCQERLPFDDGTFDRVLAIHVLEHLPNLPAAIREMRRVIAPSGTLSVVLPFEGSLAYSIARKLSAERLWKRRYPGEDYRWFIEREHINSVSEVLAELTPMFTVRHRRAWPIPIGGWCNLVVGFTLVPA